MKKIKNFIKLGISFLCFFLLGSIVSLFLNLIGIDLKNISALGEVIYQFALSVIIFIIIVGFYRKEVKDDYKIFKKDIGNNIKKIIKLFIVFMIVKYIVSLITVLIMMLLKMDTNSITSVNQEMIETYFKASPLLMGLSAAVLAPIYEEILFRMGIKNVIGKNFIFVLISGFIFGILHVFPLSEGVTLTMGIIQSISYVTMGIFLAGIYKNNNNIYISIGVHFLNNLLSVLTMINMM